MISSITIQNETGHSMCIASPKHAKELPAKIPFSFPFQCKFIFKEYILKRGVHMPNEVMLEVEKGT